MCLQEENRDPLQRGYSRVDTAEGSLSNSSTSTSLDTVLIEANNELLPLPRQHNISAPNSQHSPRQPPKKTFSPILESDESSNAPQQQSTAIVKNVNEKHSTLRSTDGGSNRGTLKSSKVSFEQPRDQGSSDEDSFEDRREHFQKKKAISADHKGILKVYKKSLLFQIALFNLLFFVIDHQDLNYLLADDRKAFQSKKHVSLDIKHSKLLERILRGSSSDEEEFQDRRKQFQSRKHKSLDSRVKFNLDKDRQNTSSSESEFDGEGKQLIHERIHDFSKPIVIDIKDLETSEDEDFESIRESFQQQRSISTDSRKR